ncbi:MAG: GNAT family N-acetyltransferase [Bacteroidetes bacterium]|nr:GNAT family N-acetyltransferase [Bacteroidota bacterium]
MIKVISFLFSDKAHAALASEIRRNVFVEEQRVSPDEEYDEHENESTHYLVYLDDKAIGTARWRKTEKGIKLERFAVLKEHRNSGAGSAVLTKVLSDVIPLNEKIYLHSQVAALNFYLKAGFVTEGDEFVEANIRHYKMTWKK